MRADRLRRYVMLKENKLMVTINIIELVEDIIWHEYKVLVCCDCVIICFDRN